MKLELINHLNDLATCRRCAGMSAGPVTGGPVASRILLVGQAPGRHEPAVGRPFAWTAGKTLFRWWHEATGASEEEVRRRVYFAAVCRCFPGKSAQGGGDRLPTPLEVENCRPFLDREIRILKPRLVITVGRLALSQFMQVNRLDEVIGRMFHLGRAGMEFDLLPLPHPSGVSSWHRVSPGRELLATALKELGSHPAVAKWGRPASGTSES